MEHVNNDVLVEYYNRLTVQKYADLWINNTLGNMQLIKNSEAIRTYRNRHEKSVAVCVGAGPSLLKNVDLLGACECVTLVAETTLPLLAKKGITPTYVVINDPSEKIAAHFDGVDTASLTLFAPYFAHPKVLQCFRGRIVFYAPVAPVNIFALCEHAIGDIGGIYSGSCVGHTLNYIAHYLGAKTIINIGQDLSYPSGARYAEGLREVDTNAGGASVRVEDIFGEEVLTDERMLSYKYIFETTVPYFLRDARFVNATEGGILRLGEICTLADALATYVK